jgi:hypothetical protein
MELGVVRRWRLQRYRHKRSTKCLCCLYVLHRRLQIYVWGNRRVAGNDAGIDQSDPFLFVPPFAMDSENPSILYFGTNRLYQTINGAASWKPIFICPSQYGIIDTFAVAPSNSDVVYLASAENNGIQIALSKNATAGKGSTWADITHGLPNLFPTQIAVDAVDPSTALVAYSGFAQAGFEVGHVYRTSNFGYSWLDISGNLPNSPVNSVLVNPLKNGQIFVGTDVGVFYTDDSSHWKPLMNGLPRVAVISLAFQASSEMLFAATHGRSVWTVDASMLP